MMSSYSTLINNSEEYSMHLTTPRKFEGLKSVVRKGTRKMRDAGSKGHVVRCL